MTDGVARQLLASYLFAYATVLTVALGALFQLMIADLADARWFDDFRPAAMQIAGAMPILAVLALPILLGAHALYPWAELGALAPAARAVVARKHAWLNVPFFIARGVTYVVIWCAIEAVWRRRVARGEDRRAMSAVGVIVLGVTLTLAAFDWIMSLEPDWYSTIFGVYVFAGGVLSALALTSLLSSGTAADDDVHVADTVPEPRRPGVERRRAALGKLLLTYAMFWGYIAFSQYLIIWIGDLPADNGWYIRRTQGSWAVIVAAAALGLLALPCIALMSHAGKRSLAVIRVVAAGILVSHVLDALWLVAPSLSPSGIGIAWSDPVALVLVAGITIIAAIRLERRRNHGGGGRLGGRSVAIDSTGAPRDRNASTRVR